MFENLTVVELRDKCKKKKLSGYSTMKKQQLINLLKKKNMKGGRPSDVVKIFAFKDNQEEILMHSDEGSLQYLTLTWNEDDPLYSHHRYENLFNDISYSLSAKKLKLSNGDLHKIKKIDIFNDEGLRNIEIIYYSQILKNT